MEEVQTEQKASTNESFVSTWERSVFGCVNGMLFYDFIYPIILLIFIQLILGANYASTIEAHQYTIQLILSLSTSIVTLIVGIIIAIPSKIIKAFKLPILDDFKLMLSTLLLIIGVTIGYNLLMTLCGVNGGSGNENQTAIVEYIKNAAFLSFVTFVLVGPVLEEVTYRYFLFGGLRKLNPKLAIIFSGFIFMLIHGTVGFISDGSNFLKEIILLPPYMFSGCMLAYAYNKSENLAVSTGAHMLNNLISFILSVL